MRKQMNHRKAASRPWLVHSLKPSWKLYPVERLPGAPGTWQKAVPDVWGALRTRVRDDDLRDIMKSESMLNKWVRGRSSLASDVSWDGGPVLDQGVGLVDMRVPVHLGFMSPLEPWCNPGPGLPTKPDLLATLLGRWLKCYFNLNISVTIRFKRTWILLVCLQFCMFTLLWGSRMSDAPGSSKIPV